MAEVIKYAFIKDKSLYDILMQESITSSLEDVIKICCKIKKELVEQDEFDKGQRMLLNFGHTLGHAIETLTEYEVYTHGEAIAIGMYQLTHYAEKLGLTEMGTSEQMKAILTKYSLPIAAPELDNNDVLALLDRDKKNLGKQLNIVLIKNLGNGYIYPTTIKFFNAVRIIPAELTGKINIPPSKSMAHRAIIGASLSEGESVLTNVAYSDDIIATIEGMKQLGAKIVKENEALKIRGANEKLEKVNIYCNESGSTLRFLIPISLVSQTNATFFGEGKLGERPLTPFYSIFDQQNISYTTKDGKLQLNIVGQLKPDKFSLDGGISSQFITGLLFALPLLEDGSTIEINTPLQSRGYVELTLKILKTFGIEVEEVGNNLFKIRGNQKYKATNYVVEGDYSQASFYFVANQLGHKIEIIGLDEDSLQGDKIIIDYLKEFTHNKEHYEFDGSECPDIIPILAVSSSLSAGETNIVNAERVRFKECDRLFAMAKELNALGAEVCETPDGLIIKGKEQLEGGVVVSSHDDHRIAMSLAIAGTRCKRPIILTNPECVTKSYPNFWEDYKKVGGKVEVVFDE